MNQTPPYLFPVRPLGQINPVKLSWPGHVPGHPFKRPKAGVGIVQADGFDSAICSLETYSGPFDASIQLDAFQTVVVVLET